MKRQVRIRLVHIWTRGSMEQQKVHANSLMRIMSPTEATCAKIKASSGRKFYGRTARKAIDISAQIVAVLIVYLRIVLPQQFFSMQSFRLIQI